MQKYWNTTYRPGELKRYCDLARLVDFIWIIFSILERNNISTENFSRSFAERALSSGQDFCLVLL